MRFALVLGSLFVGSLSFIVACTGGPGTVDQGGSSDQYGTITGASGPGVTPDNSGGGAEGETPNPTTPPAGGNGGGGGGGGQDIKANEFDQDCEQDSDCTAVQEGTVCTVCLCNNAAVSSSEASDFNQDRNSRIARCDVSSFTNTDPNACTPCQQKTPKCEGKKCQLR